MTNVPRNSVPLSEMSEENVRKYTGGVPLGGVATSRKHTEPYVFMGGAQPAIIGAASLFTKANQFHGGYWVGYTKNVPLLRKGDIFRLALPKEEPAPDPAPEPVSDFVPVPNIKWHPESALLRIADALERIANALEPAEPEDENQNSLFTP